MDKIIVMFVLLEHILYQDHKNELLEIWDIINLILDGLIDQFVLQIPFQILGQFHEQIDLKDLLKICQVIRFEIHDLLEHLLNL